MEQSEHVTYTGLNINAVDSICMHMWNKKDHPHSTMRAQPVDIKGINKRDLKASQKNNKDGWGAEDSQSESQHIDLDNEND